VNDLLKYTNNHIVLDLVETWPQNLVNLMYSNKEVISLYLKEEERVEFLGRVDIEIRRSPPENPYKRPYFEILHHIDTMIINHTFIGIHGSRLIQEEINNIITEGLKPLSQDLVYQKLLMLRGKKLLDEDAVNLIFSKSQYTCINRVGSVSMNHCSSRLKEGSGFCKLFYSWGGEAIYQAQNAEIKQILHNIGTPCISICVVNAVEMKEVSEKIAKIWYLLQNGYSLSSNCDIDNRIKRKVDVLAVISRDNKDFDCLTQYSE